MEEKTKEAAEQSKKDVAERELVRSIRKVKNQKEIFDMIKDLPNNPEKEDVTEDQYEKVEAFNASQSIINDAAKEELEKMRKMLADIRAQNERSRIYLEEDHEVKILELAKQIEIMKQANAKCNEEKKIAQVERDKLQQQLEMDKKRRIAVMVQGKMMQEQFLRDKISRRRQKKEAGGQELAEGVDEGKGQGQAGQEGQEEKEGKEGQEGKEENKITEEKEGENKNKKRRRKKKKGYC